MKITITPWVINEDLCQISEVAMGLIQKLLPKVEIYCNLCFFFLTLYYIIYIHLSLSELRQLSFGIKHHVRV